MSFLCIVSCHLHKWEFYFFFSSQDFFISFSSLIAVARISKTMLNNSSESGHPCLVPDLRGNAFGLSPLRIMCAVGLLYTAFIMLRFFLCLFSGEFFYHKCVLNLSKAFSASIQLIIWLLSFSLLIWCITLIDLHILKNPCIPGIKPTWSWCMNFLICCWSLFHA